MVHQGLGGQRIVGRVPSLVVSRIARGRSPVHGLVGSALRASDVRAFSMLYTVGFSVTGAGPSPTSSTVSTTNVTK